MKYFVPSLLALSLGLFVALPQAQASLATSWTLTNGSCSGCGSYGNVRSFAAATAGGGDVAASAWADTGSGNTLETAELKSWSGGLGITNRSGLDGGYPDHAIDNRGNYDAVLFSFDKTVSLDEIVIGWWKDADLSVLAYTGSGTPDLSGQTYAALDDAQNGSAGGWELVGNYFDPQDSSEPGDGRLHYSINSGGISSSYWLVSALNPAFNTPGCNSRAIDCAPSNYLGNDYFKLYALAGTVTTSSGGGGGNTVPAPASLLLLALGLPLLRLSRCGGKCSG